MKKNLSLLTALLISSALSSQLPATKIYTDFNGFWDSSALLTVPDNSHNLLAFKAGTTTYSTGVDDAVLTTNGITFSPGNYASLPITTHLTANSDTYIGVGLQYGGSGNVTPTPVSQPFSKYLEDGIKGLDLGTAIFNFPASGLINYEITTINPASIGDGIPDLIITQMGDIGSVFDKFSFRDINGNVVGTEYIVDLSTVPSLGSLNWKFYNANVNPPLYNNSGGLGNPPRDLRVLSLDWSDLGITAADIPQIIQFAQDFSGQSDSSFTAYNKNSIRFHMPISGTVFLDTNAGVPDGTPYQNATVLLKNGLGTTVATTTTDVNGTYIFSNLEAGDYTVELEVPIGYHVVGNSNGTTSPTLLTTVNNSPVINLNFGIDQICTVGVNGEDFGWDFPSGAPSPVTQVFTQPAANYGFVLDIFSLDNSFNMIVNGSLLAAQEIEFQSAGTSGINVRFADGDQYEINTPDIWQMTGTLANPLLRVTINPNGVVTMEGSKTSGGPLFPLVFTNGSTFNIVTWNAASTNTIITQQNVQGVTNISGRGYGLNTAPCFCIKPGNTGTPDGFTKMGILTKATPTVLNWPESVPNGHIVLDSASKGLVVTHMTTAQRDALIAVDGMIIYNTDLGCVQLYRGNTPGLDVARVGWNCIKRGCNE